MIVYIVALEGELPQQSDMDIRYCGVGKVNAAHATMKAIADGATKIVNFGTAGLIKRNKGHEGLVQVSHIVQRDMQAEPQAPRGTTPFESYATNLKLGLAPNIIEHGQIQLIIGADPVVRLGTGDSFVMEHDDWFNKASVDIVDMEAYAIAKCCALEAVEFECYKWISDFADENAAETWEQNQADGADAFLNMVKKRL
ncbi:MAG: hypothetical protein CBE00_08425 [Planctomycetaceae bacterium TMED240]|nr:MAG: hypothetical protein CBE00_08425 [Planctomycetaceae bacterium TMED240]